MFMMEIPLLFTNLFATALVGVKVWYVLALLKWRALFDDIT